MAWSPLEAAADVRTGYYRTGDRPLELRLLRREADVPGDPNGWEKQTVPGYGDAWVAKTPLFRSADIEWIRVRDRRRDVPQEFQGQIDEEDRFIVLLFLAPTVWDRAAEQPNDQKLLLLLADQPIGVSAIRHERMLALPFSEETVRTLVNGLQPWDDLEDSWLRADRTRAYLEWLAQCVASAPAKPVGGEQIQRYRRWLDQLAGIGRGHGICDLAASLVDRFIEHDSMDPDAEEPKVAVVAECYAAREEDEQANRLIDHVRRSSSPARDVLVAKMTQRVAETKAEIAQDPMLPAYRFLSAHDCPNLVHATERLMAGPTIDPSMGGIIIGSVQCLMESGNQEAAKQLVERVRPLPIPLKELWLPKVEQILRQ
jgi:hypothetical protein